MAKPPIVNCHSHIFTAGHVPPFLAKSYVPWPFYYLLHLGFIVSVFRWWYQGPGKIRYRAGYKKFVKIKTAILAVFARLHPLEIILGYYVFFFAFFLLYGLVKDLFNLEETKIGEWIEKVMVLTDRIFPDVTSTWLAILIITVVFIFFDTIRNFIFMLARLVWKALGKLPGPQTKEMFQRYLNIGRYAFHQQQKTILSKLKSQYPKGTGFVTLPMDMEYMQAGPCKFRYRDQMQELAEVKNMSSNKKILYPFIFADPRRMVDVKKEINYKEGDLPYFEWEPVDGKVVLKECFIKQYLDEYNFTGIKIYPALGYYPFDAKLLPLWKYCADNGIPVLTHCIRGTIFYRGVKKQKWNEHPVFEQAMKKITSDSTDDFKDDEDLEKEQVSNYIPLVLSQQKNVDFSYNFTHPLNFICILEEELLRKVITKAVSNKNNQKGGNKKHTEKLKELFGYKGIDYPIERNLRKLKICLGHFGGEDEWKRYFEKDRYNYSSQLTKNPDIGIQFLKTMAGKPSRGKIEHIWKYTDWYSIICSMMLLYPCVFADISYILHGDRDILPLLKQTLKHDVLKRKVLYGTDFFVVRNHKSDKNMLADMEGGLSETEFDLIARTNPVDYLQHVPCVDKEQQQ